MGENRIEELLRDPTLDQPALDYFEVRLGWRSFTVGREAAERIMDALLAIETRAWLRVETVTGSVLWLRAEDVLYVREWTVAQRAAERWMWKQIDEEDEDEDEGSNKEVKKDGVEGSGETEGVPTCDAPTALAIVAGVTALVSAVATAVSIIVRAWMT